MSGLEENENCLYGGPMSDDITQGCNSLGEFLIKGLQTQKDKIIVVNDDTGENLTASVLLAKSICVAENLRKCGVKAGDCVAIVSKNSMEYYYIIYGTIYLGATIVPINTIYKEHDTKQFLKLTSPKIVFASLCGIDNVLAEANENPKIEKVVVIGTDERCESFENFLKFDSANLKDNFHCDAVDIKENIVTILLSSGTSGVAKAAELTQLNIFSYTSLKYVLEFNSFTISPGSFAHASGFLFVLTLPPFGEKGAFITVHNDTRFIECLEKYKIQAIFVSPGYLRGILDHPSLDKYDLSNLNFIVCGSNVVSESLIEETEQKLDAAVLRTYGLTETFTVISQSPLKAIVKNSIGTLRPGVWGKIVDPETNQMLGPNQAGEIVVKSCRQFKGYHKDPVATAKTIDKDGFMHTGDLGYYDNDGNWFFLERMKDLIIYKDVHIYPSQLEPILLQHPRVIEACVIGVPSELYGELAAAFVVIDKMDDNVTEQEILDFVAARVDDDDRLRGGVRFIDKIPKTDLRKPLRRVLRQLAVSK